jgi:hypothetical protein
LPVPASTGPDQRIGILWNCEETAPEPTSVVLTCGDGGLYVTDLTWVSWDETHAVGNGLLHAVTETGPDAGNVEVEARFAFSRPLPESDLSWIPAKGGGSGMVFSHVVISTGEPVTGWPETRVSMPAV